MFLKNGLNLKQILTRFCLLFALILISDLYFNQTITHIIIGLTIAWVIWIIYQFFVDGFYILLKSVRINEKNYQVRDFIIPKSLKKSYREIGEAQSTGCSSRSPLFENNNEIFYLDIVSLLSKDLAFRKVLILGGAGGSLANYFSKKNKTQEIDVIENSLIMINLANKYFLKTNKKINLIYGDGLNFIKHTLDSYDLIIIDMFDAYKFHKGIINNSFVKDVKNTIGENGFFIVNLGFATELDKVIKSWQKSFTLYIYLSHANLLISNIKCDSFKYNSPHRFLFEIPQLRDDV